MKLPKEIFAQHIAVLPACWPSIAGLLALGRPERRAMSREVDGRLPQRDLPQFLRTLRRSRLATISASGFAGRSARLKTPSWIFCCSIPANASRTRPLLRRLVTLRPRLPCPLRYRCCENSKLSKARDGVG
jgi:hypothetical protein